MKYLLLIIPLACFAIAFFASARPTEANKHDTEQSSFHSLPVVPDTASFAGEPLPLDRQDVREALDREMLTNSFWHTNTIITIKRANRYFPVVEPILEEHGIPEDFKYLMVAESAVVPTAKSPAGAVGLWQILESVAKENNLIVNDEVDQRYDVELSTRTACKILKRSYDALGSWTLAAAAYNGGLTRVRKNLAQQMQSSYYSTLWSEETGRYVFRIVAIKTIFQDPERYGFKIDEKSLYAPYNVADTMISTPIADIAKFAISWGSSYKEIKTLNPWLRQNKLSNPNSKQYKIYKIND